MERLLRATNTHDLDALASCFAADYRNQTPVHPARGFVGREQVRRNWRQIFDAVPDVTAEVVWTADGHTVWSEWEMRGTRPDGSPHLMRGVVIFELDADGNTATSARFYLEPVDADPAGVDEAVGRQVRPEQTPVDTRS